MRALSAPLLRLRTPGALAALLTSAFASTAHRARPSSTALSVTAVRVDGGVYPETVVLVTDAGGAAAHAR
jgi:hypothetical protein